MMWRAAVLVGTVLALAGAVPAQRHVRVRLDPSLNEPIRAIAGEFEKTRKGVNVQLSAAPSGAAEVTLGSTMPTKTTGKRLFALDRMVIVAPLEPARVTKFAHIGLNLKLAVPTPATLPGRRAATVLQQASGSYGRDWAANVKRNSKLSPATADEAVKLVLAGQADAAVVNASAAAGSKLRILAIPADLDEPIEQYGVAASEPLAEAFLEFLFSKGNQQRLVLAGFSSPIAPTGDIAVIKPGSMMRLFTAALGTLKQETVKVEGQSFKGASLSSILGAKGTTATIVGADGASVTIPLRQLSRRGGILQAMGDGNYRAVVPGRSSGQWVRWVRRIEVR